MVVVDLKVSAIGFGDSSLRFGIKVLYFKSKALTFPRLTLRNDDQSGLGSNPTLVLITLGGLTLV